MRCFIFTFIILAVPSIAFSDTIIVPDDYPKIQQAIDAAVNGDMVLVKSGTYVENIDFLGKAITVTSSDGPAVTIIDGGNPSNPDFGSCVLFMNYEGADSVLDGFTLTKGIGTLYSGYNYGGGAHCRYTSPTIRNNVFKGNSAYRGGGIYCYDSTLILVNNIFAGNSASASGGGIYISSASPILSNNTFYGNSAKNSGGGITTEGSATHLTITNTIVWKNSASSYPEIRFYGGSSVTVTYCDVKGGWSGTGNINKDPRFINPDNEDFHLYVVSPCIDAGSNLAPSLPEFDFEGDDRIQHGIVDMGVDEADYTLMTNATMIPASQANEVDFDLYAENENASRDYILLGGISGTDPGTLLPGGMMTLPMNWDFFTNVVVAYINTTPFQNFMGTLFLDGSGNACFNTLGPLPSGTVGLTFNFAYALNKPWDFVSNPVGIEVVP